MEQELQWKTVAQLDSQGYFIGTILVQESPLERGTFLYPPNCVDTVPPQFDISKYRARWDGTGYWLESLPGELPPPEISPELKLERLKKAKIELIVDTVNFILEQYTYDYSEPEKLSWSKQEQEARELSQNPDAPAPFLRHLAEVRGIDVMVLKDRILFNVENYQYLSALLIGVQQRHTDWVNSRNVDDIEELLAFTPQFPV